MCLKLYTLDDLRDGMELYSAWKNPENASNYVAPVADESSPVTITEGF